MNRPRKTALDYAIVALSPALIIAMVCSLVWFLLEVFYQGYADTNLRFIFFAFVFAAVLISRISIEAGRQRAAMYGIALAIVTWLALLRFVEIRGSLAGISWLINLILLGLIWWSISRLTWDCTFLDEAKDTSGEGLLQNMGLDGAKETEASDQPLEQPLTFRERMKERRRRPHAHGLWVVYFSLAALPLFGVGQMFVASGPDGSSFFWLIFVYLGSAFGLLVTTSLLGLRKYLRERKVSMPPDIAGSWLAKGAVLVIVLLLVVWLLPRPQHVLWSAEMPFTFGSPDDLDTSKLAPGDEGKPDEEKADRTSEQAEKGQGSSSNADESGGKGEGDENQGDPSGEKGKDGASAKDGKDESPKDGGQNDESAKDEQSKDSDGSKKDDGEKDESEKDEGKDEGSEPDESEQRESSGGGSSSSSESSGGSDESSDEDDSSSSESSSTSSSVTGAIGNLLKWMFILAMLMIGAIMAWRYREQIVAGWKQFLAELHEFWRRLFGGRKPKKSAAAAIETPASITQQLPFSAFTNPFAAGTANRYTPNELVQYSFEALEAWARENGCPRNSDQTPHEFAQQVGLMHGSLFGDAENLADLYCQVAFAEAELSPDDVESLASLWQLLAASSHQPAIA